MGQHVRKQAKLFFPPMSPQKDHSNRNAEFFLLFQTSEAISLYPPSISLVVQRCDSFSNPVQLNSTNLIPSTLLKLNNSCWVGMVPTSCIHYPLTGNVGDQNAAIPTGKHPWNTSENLNLLFIGHSSADGMLSNRSMPAFPYLMITSPGEREWILF